MPTLEIAVERYMTSPVISIGPDDSLDVAQQRLVDRGVSSLAVVADGTLVGVISRTDLLRIGRLRARSHPHGALLELPDKPVLDAMTRSVLCVKRSDTVALAASHMWTNEYHRLLVTDDDRLVGVISTRDVMAGIRDARVDLRLSDYMSSPLFVVDADEPISRATSLLERAQISGLIVTENDWPVGLFTQIEALESRDLAPDTPAEQVMNPAFICMPVSTLMHRAAAQAVAMRVRRVIAVEHRDIQGILTGIDFAHCAADLAATSR